MLPSRPLLLLLALGACATTETGNPEDSSGMVEVAITTTTIPSDGACVHIIATRLADFQTTEFVGLLSGAKFKTYKGETRVSAAAFPEPCDSEPPAAPWHAADQTVTFNSGPNTLHLSFSRNVNVNVTADFDDTNPQPLSVESGTLVRTGRNGEAAAGPDFSLDGWEVKQIALPPIGGGGVAAESVLFSTEGHLAYSPRGMAHLGDGRFVFQLAEPDAPLAVFDAAGTFVENWSVSVPAGMQVWDYTDGIAAVTDTQFIRTAWSNTGVCDLGGNCQYAGIDVLDLQTAPDGSHYLQVTQQIFLPNVPSFPMDQEYPVGVAASGGLYYVTTVPGGYHSHLVALNADGTVALGPVDIVGSDEGLAPTNDGRLMALDYDGLVQAYDPSTLAPRAGESLSYSEGVDVSNVFHVVSDGASGLIAYASDNNHPLVRADAAFTSIQDINIDLSTFVAVRGMDYRPDTGELGLADALPPLDAATNTRIPVVRFFDLATLAEGNSIQLAGVPLPVRFLGFAIAPSLGQIYSFYRRPGGAADAIDSQVFVHDLAGNLITSFDLSASAGVSRIFQIHWNPSTAELVLMISDASGTGRVLVTDAAGNPRRSYRTDASPYPISDVAPTPAGDFAAVTGQPSFFLRVLLP